MMTRDAKRKPKTAKRRLKKQPQWRRVQAATAVTPPRLIMPKQTARAARRRRHQQWRIKWQWPTALLKRILFSTRWLSLTLLAATIYALAAVGMSPNFYLTTLPIEGVFSVAPEEIALASGLAGQHIFTADPAQAALAINQVPGVIRATVEIEWPNRVHIRVAEDIPVAIWEDSDSSFWVNEQGQLLPARLELPGLFRIQADSTQAVIGRTFDEENATSSLSDETAPQIKNLGAIPQDVLEGALLLAELFPEQPTIRYDTRHGLVYHDARGWDVYLGTGPDMVQKLVVYDNIVAELQAQNYAPEYISVSNQQKPYFMAYQTTED